MFGISSVFRGGIDYQFLSPFVIFIVKNALLHSFMVKMYAHAYEQVNALSHAYLVHIFAVLAVGRNSIERYKIAEKVLSHTSSTRYSTAE